MKKLVVLIATFLILFATQTLSVMSSSALDLIPSAANSDLSGNAATGSTSNALSTHGIILLVFGLLLVGTKRFHKDLNTA